MKLDGGPWGRNRKWWGRLQNVGGTDALMDALVTAFQDGWISEYQLWDVCTHHLSPVPEEVAVRVFARLGFAWGKGWPLQKVSRTVLARRATWTAMLN